MLSRLLCASCGLYGAVACGGPRPAVTAEKPAPAVTARVMAGPASSTAERADERAASAVVCAPAPALAQQEPRVLPNRITSHEPGLGRDLDPTKPLWPHFTTPPVERQAHALAARLIDTVRAGMRGRRWTSETRTGCAVEADGNVFVEGRLLVRDESNRVRAFSETIGTEDSAGFWKLYYDERSVLRAATFSWANYRGEKADGVMLFNASGQFVRCSSLPGDAGVIFCGAQGDTNEPLAPEVTAVTLPSVPGLPDSVRWVMARDPVAEFAKCETRYHPTP